MRVMGIEARSAPWHEQSRARAQDIPLPAARPEDVVPNHVWAADVTYIPMACGPLSGGDIDWASRAVWHGGCRTPTMRVLRGGARGGALGGKPRINTQGPTTAEAHRQAVTAGVEIRWTDAAAMDNTSNGCAAHKYEEVHLKAYADGREARAGIGLDDLQRALTKR